MRQEIKEGEEDGEGLLHAQEAIEWPFPVELDNFIICCDALIGDYVLACVVAFGRARPKEEAMEESWIVLEEWQTEGRMHTNCCR